MAVFEELDPAVAARAREMCRRLDDDPRVLSNAYGQLRDATAFTDGEVVDIMIDLLRHDGHVAYANELIGMTERAVRENRVEGRRQQNANASPRGASSDGKGGWWIPVESGAAAPQSRAAKVMGFDEDGTLVVDLHDGHGPQRSDGSGQGPRGRVTR